MRGQLALLRFEVFFQLFFDLFEVFGDVFALFLDHGDFLRCDLGDVNEVELCFIEFLAQLLTFFGADFGGGGQVVL